MEGVWAFVDVIILATVEPFRKIKGHIFARGSSCSLRVIGGLR